LVKPTDSFWKGTAVDVSLSSIPGAFHLPRPDWDAIQGWVEERIAEADRPAAWARIAGQWLDVLNEALGGNYQTEQSDRLLLFAPRDYAEAEHLLGYAESGLQAIVEILGDAAGASWHGPLVLLLFADAETYCRYVLPFDPDGEYFRSGGACFKQGYVHLALRPTHLDSLQSVVLHELTHACLWHLSLPLWLEEGITQMIQTAQITLEGTTAAEIRRYWQEHGLRDFWWGRGFFLDDEGQGASYELAEILYRILESDHRRQLRDFIRHAHADDAGDSAAHQFLGKGIAAVASQFLGPGSWEPVPPDGPTWCRRGVLYLSRKQYDLALSDFEEAIRCDPRLASAYTNRGFVRYQLGQYAVAITDYEQAIQLDPFDFAPHNNLAWIRATCPEASSRNGKQALEHANKACELTRFTEWDCLGSLAAAHAEVEEFEEARRYAKESLRLAPPEEHAECKERLRLYRERKPYREARGPQAI